MRLPGFLKAAKPVVARYLEYCLLFYYGSTAKRRRCRAASGKVLLARTDGLGDFILWLSCAGAFREMYPDKKIVLMLDSTKPTIELAGKMPQYFDEVFNIDIHNYTRFLAIRKMKRMEFDLVVQPVYSRVLFTDILLFACRAGRRVTLDTSAKFMTRTQLKLSNRGYDRILCASPGIRHELVRCGELIRGLGNTGFRAGLPALKAGTAEKEDYFVCFPAASDPAKIWEGKKYVRVLEAVIKRTGWRCILGGGAEDLPLLGRIAAGITRQDMVEIAAGRGTLSDTVLMLRRARMAVGNDTGAMHMAAASGVPSVVLLGDSEIGRFFPYAPETGEKPLLWTVDADMGCRCCKVEKDVPCRYPYGPEGRYRCVDAISVECCMRAVEQCLEAAGYRDEGTDKASYVHMSE